MIVREALAYFARLIHDHPQPEELIREFDQTDGAPLIAHIREAIQREAEPRGASEQEFAGTLLVAIIHETYSCFYQIGDGVWSISRNGVLGAATWPQQGEFAGQTVFVTSVSSADAIQFITVHGSVDYIVGMTDGLERLALDLRARVPHRGFCDPLIGGLNKVSDGEELRVSLDAFLESERVRDRTDDDLTLALIAHVRSV